MHLGLAGTNIGGLSSPSTAVRLAVLAEELGYESLWTSEHILLPDVPSGEHRWPADLPMLAPVIVSVDVEFGEHGWVEFTGDDRTAEAELLYGDFVGPLSPPGSTSIVTDPPGLLTKKQLRNFIDDLDSQFTHPTEFVVPGGNAVAAWLDLGRTVVRRAERHALGAAEAPSLVVPYLNRLSDLLWTMARWHEGTSLIARDV